MIMRISADYRNNGTERSVIGFDYSAGSGAWKRVRVRSRSRARRSQPTQCIISMTTRRHCAGHAPTGTADSALRDTQRARV